MLVPQLTLLETPGRVYWRFSDGDDFENSSEGPLATLEQALEDVGADSKSTAWVDITYRGVVWDSCQQWELAPYAAKIPAVVSLRNPSARADTGRMLSSSALMRACSDALAALNNSGGVASTTLITWSRATWRAAQYRKSEPIKRTIVLSTHGGSGGAESASAGGL